MPTFSLTQKHYLLDVHNAQIMLRIAKETESSDTPISTVCRATLGGDERRLRGIPALGRGVAGAILHTRPGDSLR